MAYPPNVKAAKFLAESILPEIHKFAPETTLLIAGATPVSAVKALSSSKIYVSGWMDDIRDAYAQSKVFIAPMEIGTGLQNKLLEAMAMKLPCVTSPLANKALGATMKKEILVGDSPETYARHALSLLRDEKHLNTIANAGYRFVTHTFSWEANTKKLIDLIEQD
jgi:glycosyltransferase involved in cell wall biosynthesis